MAIMPYVSSIPGKIAVTTIGVAVPSVIYVIGSAVVSEIAPVAQRGAVLAIGTAVATSAGCWPLCYGQCRRDGGTPLAVQHRPHDLRCHHAGRRHHRDSADAPRARDDAVRERNAGCGGSGGRRITTVGSYDGATFDGVRSRGAA